MKKFGTLPVFLTAISTILGAVMFLRFGFAVGQVGFWGTIAIILIGHAVTIPTAMAIAEIATNQKVEGGGEYYIISRSFGLVIGSTIGIALYFSQAISIAFYVMAFSEAFTSLIDWLTSTYAMPDWLFTLLQMKQTIGIPALLALTYIMLTKGANLGVKALYIVVVTLAISLIAFFLGTGGDLNTPDVVSTEFVQDTINNIDTTFFPQGDEVPIVEMNTSPPTSSTPDDSNPINKLGFFIVFAIIFPAFTGMTAGVGLSGDLKNPGKSIPLGTLAATIAGMVMYFFLAYKLHISASPESLMDTTHLVMADIAWQGWWLIPVGLAAATISSALGSIMVAPRTLQAIARDRIFPTPRVNNWLSLGKGKTDEPFNATLITIIIAGIFIFAGALDGVAQIISMFFMVSYGTLSLISFLNHFASDPAYRPTFKSRWYISLFGAIASFGLMFFMNPMYAFSAVLMIIVLYFLVSFYNKDKTSMAVIFQGVLFQFVRRTHVFLQNADKEQSKSWRPSAVAISEDTFKRLDAFNLMRWIAHQYGFGTYIHFIKGYLSKETNKIGKETKAQLIKMAESTNSHVIVDTIISPSFTSTVAQVIQLPGIAGTDNNLLLFEYPKDDLTQLDDLVDNFKLIRASAFDTIILGSSHRGFSFRKKIHIWITSKDYDNASLMILLAYIIMGHKDWRHSTINIFALFPEEKLEKERKKLIQLISEGQLPISPSNVEFIRIQEEESRTIISEKSKMADLTILGFNASTIKRTGVETFANYDELGNVLFVNAAVEKVIK